MEIKQTLKLQLEKAVQKAVSLDGNLDQHAAVSRNFWCNMANDLLGQLELLGEDPEELLAAINV